MVRQQRTEMIRSAVTKRKTGKRYKLKTVYLIGGTMGVGKTTVCQQLKEDLPNSVFLDGDWCWNASPFLVTQETKSMVMDNICYLLNNFLKCSAYENVIFGWVMHEQSIIDSILSRLNVQNCTVHSLSLTVNESCLRQRLSADIEKGIRHADIIEKKAFCGSRCTGSSER